MKKTIIEGRETWWAVCCSNECSSVYWGPYFEDDEWLGLELRGGGCEYAHFKARYVPEHARAAWGNHSNVACTEAGVDRQEAVSWVLAHTNEAISHPNYRKPDRSGDAHERAEKVLTEAVQR